MGKAAARSRPQPRLVALDANGTLLKNDGASVSDRTREVLGRVQDLGIPVVLVTGRSLDKALTTLEAAGLRQYVVTENGVRAVRLEDRASLFELWLPGPEVAAPLRRLRQGLGEACSFAQLSADGGFIEATHPWLREAGPPRDAAMRQFRHIVPDVVEALTDDRRYAKCYVTVESSSDFAATMRRVQEVAGDGWVIRQIKQLLPGGTTNTCEVQCSLVNKADGLAALCKAISVDPADVWAFGDEVNDARMLQEMGWGVRMANHAPGLEGLGDDVTTHTNEEDGVAVYLETHLLAGV